MYKVSAALTALILSTGLTLATVSADPAINTTAGISGDQDLQDRNPTLSVSAEVHSGGVRILANAEVSNSDYQHYPIRFEFYVNRKLVLTQMRSTELPGPVGFDVAPSVATPPFNYSVVATALTPNRQFTTVLHGAVFASDLAQALDCSLTVKADKTAAETLYQASAVETQQSGNNSFRLSYTGKSEDESAEAEVDVTLTLPETPQADFTGELQGTAAVKTSIAGEANSVKTSGTVTFTAGKISAVSQASSDDLLTLECSGAS